MTDQASSAREEAAAERRLKTVGAIVTLVWVLGLVVYVWGLASTASGLRLPAFDPRAWRDNVSFLTDWTSLIVISSSFFALLWWPKKVVETLVGLLSKHRIRFEAFLRSLFRNPNFAQSPPSPSGQPSETSAAVASEGAAGATDASSDANQGENRVAPPSFKASTGAEVSTAPAPSSRGYFRWIALVGIAVVGLLALAFCNGSDHQEKIADRRPSGAAENLDNAETNDRTYLMRAGDERGAVYAITKSIGDPQVRSKCVEALERDPNNRPPLDRRQRPGHRVPLPIECPTP